MNIIDIINIKLDHETSLINNAVTDAHNVINNSDLTISNTNKSIDQLKSIAINRDMHQYAYNILVDIKNSINNDSMKLSEWLKSLHKERGITSIRDLTTDERNLLQTKYGLIRFSDIIQCERLIKLINAGTV